MVANSFARANLVPHRPGLQTSLQQKATAEHKRKLGETLFRALTLDGLFSVVVVNLVRKKTLPGHSIRQ